jgi:hypothetical protein
MNSLVTKVSFMTPGKRYNGILVGSDETTITIQLHKSGNRKKISRFDITDLHISVEDMSPFSHCLKCGEFVLDGNPNHDCEDLWV